MGIFKDWSFRPSANFPTVNSALRTGAGTIRYTEIQLPALKTLLEKYDQVRQVYYLDRPRKDRRLPTVLSEEEVKSLLEATSNIKHRCPMFMLYSSGLRVSELLRLKWGDIDADRMVVYIRGAKGQKDRISLLSRVAYDSLQHYMDLDKPVTWLFEGPGGGQYGATSVNKVICVCTARLIL